MAIQGLCSIYGGGASRVPPLSTEFAPSWRQFNDPAADVICGGIAFARENGARLLEACPIDLSRDSRSIGLFVGSSRVFEKAGFERLVERKPGRPLMRLVL